MLGKLLPVVLLSVAAGAQSATHFDGKSWWDTVKVLADDRFAGRETGSRGEQQAQAYIVDQLKAIG